MDLQTYTQNNDVTVAKIIPESPMAQNLREIKRNRGVRTKQLNCRKKLFEKEKTFKNPEEENKEYEK